MTDPDTIALRAAKLIDNEFAFVINAEFRTRRLAKIQIIVLDAIREAATPRPYPLNPRDHIALRQASMSAHTFGSDATPIWESDANVSSRKSVILLSVSRTAWPPPGAWFER